MRKNSHTAGAVCVRRADLRGLRLDKTAMLAVEKALGHESMHTFASHYAQKTFL